MFYGKKEGASSAKHHPGLMKKASVSIVFNGEVYNFQELREELQEEGYAFTTGTDTEVILASYLEWGTRCVQKFNGMWAFCIHDKRKKQLFCSRDRLGQKPFHYYNGEEGFIFSSEIKGILQHTKLKINRKENIDKESIDLMLSLGFIPAPKSIYKNVRKLEAGHNLTYDLTKRKAHVRRYFHPPKYQPEYNKQKLIAEGRELLKDATRLRLIADVPVGAFLSGGLDSSAVVGEMAEFVELKKLHTFSIGFKEKGGYDETKYMEIVRKAFGTKHHHKYFTEEEFEKLLDTIFTYYDEPFGDYSMFPTTTVSALARQHVTVCLSGDGGDEIFGGYLTHKLAAQMTLIRKLPRWMRKVGYWKLSLLPLKGMGKMNQLREALRISLLPPEEFYNEGMAGSMMKPAAYKKWTTTRLREALRLSNGNFIEAMIKNDLYHYTLPDWFLVKVDRASMAHALEVRSPFLDHRWIEYSARIPTEWKTSPFTGKKLMREIIKGIVPRKIVKRGKQGFTPPIDKWIEQPHYRKRLAQGLKELAKEGILDQAWINFYERAAKEESLYHQTMKIKLFLLVKWMEEWVSK